MLREDAKSRTSLCIGWGPTQSALERWALDARGVVGLAKRGPRGDIDKERILRAAETLLEENGVVEGISLRGLAAELGVATNTIYTYFSSLEEIWHDLADERLGMIGVPELVNRPCRHCAMREMRARGRSVVEKPGTLSLLRRQPVLGPHSLALSEAVMTLLEESPIGARNAHDLIVSWLYGAVLRESEGWGNAVGELGASRLESDFPRLMSSELPDSSIQFEALLRGIDLTCMGADTCYRTPQLLTRNAVDSD